ncbi:hypothetical protein HNR00_003308 [Methylorubrum rhodinum]|uniref:Uncharacterized protein n=1 Tax=Methylorubrum rhodinum TaxID=29428 RepID=A0A840ZNF6_9HYPH|nr:hypothetical protein [Methylorubrum rhodinum]
MSAPRSEFEEEALDTLILAAFRQAQREGHREVVEHLMRALEALAEADDPRSAAACVAEAYLGFADEQGTGRASPMNEGRPRRPH